MELDENQITKYIYTSIVSDSMSHIKLCCYFVQIRSRNDIETHHMSNILKGTLNEEHKMNV